MIQGTVDDGNTTSNTNWAPITAEKLAKPSGKILLANILQNLQSGGHKVLIFSQMVFVLDFLEDMLRVKQSKYERLDGSNSTSHQVGAIDRFFHMSYQRFAMIFRTRAGGLGLELPASDTNVIFDNDWNPKLRTTISPLCVLRR